MNKVQKYYNQKSLTYKISDSRFEKILELIKAIKNHSILDVGCSTGYLGKHLERNGARVTGVDISQEAIKKAKKVLSSAITLDLNTSKLPFKKKSFNLVIASEIIEHLFEPIDALNEFNRVLKRGGDLIISTPNFLYWGNRLKFLRGNFKYTKSGPFDEGHIHFYTYQTLKEDLARTGFEIIKDNHVFAGQDTLKIIRNIFPGMFAYQFVVRCQKIRS